MNKVRKAILHICNHDETNTGISNARPSHLTDIHRVENSVLIWLDANLDENSRKSITLLENIINNVNIFTNTDQCLTFLNEIIDAKVFMIISGTTGEHIVSKIHHFNQIDSIYIYCMDKFRHEQWFKIKGVFTNMSELCDVLQQTVREYERNSISISFLMPNKNSPDEDFDQLQQTFLYTYVLKDILLTINFEKVHFNEFIEYCQQMFIKNKTELHMIEKLKRKYNRKSAIHWYTRECFLYRMLNHVLRSMEIDIIIKMGFFIQDLHRQIEYLHSKQFHNQLKPFLVYRGQGLSKHNFQQLMLTQGGLLSFNNFLSTSTNHDVSLKFAQSSRRNPSLIGVVFVMNIDPSESSVPFASIKNISSNGKEDEILFSMHTVFRIGSITPPSENNAISYVELIQVNETHHELSTVIKRLPREIQGCTGWDRLGRFFIKLGLYDKAQLLYETLFKTITDEHEKANIYNQFGWIKDIQNQYDEAIRFYNESLAIIERISSNDLNRLASLYTNIGIVYTRMGDYTQALSYHEKALEFRKKIFHKHHPALADSYNNLGLVYFKSNDLVNAQIYLENSVELRQKDLPSNHPSLATSYFNLGLLYQQMGENTKAKSFYQKALEIRQKVLPSNHPDLIKSLNSIRFISDN